MTRTPAVAVYSIALPLRVTWCCVTDCSARGSLFQASFLSLSSPLELVWHRLLSAAAAEPFSSSAQAVAAKAVRAKPRIMLKSLCTEEISIDDSTVTQSRRGVITGGSVVAQWRVCECLRPMEPFLRRPSRKVGDG